MKNGPFSKSAVILLLAAALALFALSVLLHAYDFSPVAGGGAAASKSGTNSYSASAIGHAGLYDILRRTGRKAAHGVDNTLAMAGADGTLIVAEPDLSEVSSADALRLIRAPRLLLVLPKWAGRQDPDHPAWISEYQPLPLSRPQSTLGLVNARSEVIRKEWPRRWPINDLGPAPTGSGVVQLIRSPDLRPLVGTGDGMLVGELVDGSRKIIVLADPDLMANHGITKGDNAAFMLKLLDGLRMWNNDNWAAPIIFDETVHGFQAQRPSPVRLLFRFPFVIVTLLTLASAVLLALAATGRFGAPLKARREIDFGKGQLIDNGARLLDYAGHHADTLTRYVRMSVRSTAQALHAPPGLDEAALAAWLDRIGKARGLKSSCAEILQNMAAVNAQSDSQSGLARLFSCARAIHRWKREILSGHKKPGRGK